MNYLHLGRNGPLVSEFALGTMTFGAETKEAEAHNQLDYFVSNGGNFIDTADVYTKGISEEIIGRWIKRRGGADDLILATKCRFNPPQGSYGASRRSIFKSVEGSLRRMNIEAVDLYFIHGWDKDTDISETLRALIDLMKMGKIHDIGWSNISGWQLQKIISTAEKMAMPVPVALQPQYNLLDRGIEIEVLPCCVENQIGLTPWSPLGGGWLTGKYSEKILPSGATRLGDDPARGVEAYDNRNCVKTYAILDAMRRIAERVERPMSHVALAWLSSRPNVISPILGARTLKQLQDNIAAKNLELSPEDLDILTRISAPGLPQYPYEFLEDWSEMTIWQRLGTSGKNG